MDARTEESTMLANLEISGFVWSEHTHGWVSEDVMDYHKDDYIGEWRLPNDPGEYHRFNNIEEYVYGHMDEHFIEYTSEHTVDPCEAGEMEYHPASPGWDYYLDDSGTWVSIDECMGGDPGGDPYISDRDASKVDIEVHQETHHDPANTMKEAWTWGWTCSLQWIVSTWLPQTAPAQDETLAAGGGYPLDVGEGCPQALTAGEDSPPATIAENLADECSTNVGLSTTTIQSSHIAPTPPLWRSGEMPQLYRGQHLPHCSAL